MISNLTTRALAAMGGNPRPSSQMPKLWSSDRSPSADEILSALLAVEAATSTDDVHTIQVCSILTEALATQTEWSFSQLAVRTQGTELSRESWCAIAADVKPAVWRQAFVDFQDSSGIQHHLASGLPSRFLLEYSMGALNGTFPCSPSMLIHLWDGRPRDPKPSSAIEDILVLIFNHPDPAPLRALVSLSNPPLLRHLCGSLMLSATDVRHRVLPDVFPMLADRLVGAGKSATNAVDLDVLDQWLASSCEPLHVRHPNHLDQVLGLWDATQLPQAHAKVLSLQRQADLLQHSSGLSRPRPRA